MLKKRLLLLFLTGCLCSKTFAQDFRKEKMDSLLNALGVNNKSMGSLVISKNDTVIYSKSIGYGFINDKKKVPLTDTTKYRIGSITKMFTATIIFRLVEEHKLSLSAPLSDFFPQLPNANHITIEHLLGHRSGLYNYTDNWDGWRFKPQTHEEMLTIIGSKKTSFKPGAKTAYSNSNYLLLGYIIEKICKKPYAEIVGEKIISKINLINTYYGQKINTDQSEAFSYGFEQGDWKQQPQTDMSAAHGAGAIVSTPLDLTKFIGSLFSYKLIGQGSLNQMLAIKEGQGLGVEQLPFYDKLVYGHSGQIDFFQSWLLYFPNEKVAVAYTSNGYGGVVVNDILKGILHIYFDKPYVIPGYKTISLNASELDKYLGVYACSQPSMKVAITKEGASLFGQATGQSTFPLEAIEKDKFQFSPHGIAIEFFPVKNEFVLKQGGGAYLFIKQK